MDKDNRPYYCPQVGTNWYEPYFDRYPNVFRRMDWWEEIHGLEFPEYVKLVMDDKIQFVHKVIVLAGENSKNQPLYKHLNRANYLTTTCVWGLDPATEEEYNNWVAERVAALM